MAKHNPNTKDSKKFLQSAKERGYENLPPSPYAENDPMLLDKLALEGHALLKEDKKDYFVNTPQAKTPPKSLETALGEKSKNAYVRARFKVLGDMPLSRRERILKMEETKDLDNLYYKEFVAMVRKIGDEYSNS